MINRRNVLTKLADDVAAVPAVAVERSQTTPQHSAQDQSSSDCVRPAQGPYADYFPNVVVTTHEGQRALFYQDLLRGKTVLINCLSVKNESVYPVMENLVKVQRLLGDRLGRDVFMYSITTEPEKETPRVLKAFAEKHGVKPGWLFLTGEPAIIEGLRGRLFGHEPAGHGHHSGPVQDCSLGLIRYGNMAVGLWGSVPAKAEPEWIVKRISWVESRQAPAGPTRRKGPTISTKDEKSATEEHGKTQK